MADPIIYPPQQHLITRITILQIKNWTCNISLLLQSTPVGSLQTGHEVIISPNKDRHNITGKVMYTMFSQIIFISSSWNHTQRWPFKLLIFISFENGMELILYISIWICFNKKNWKCYDDTPWHKSHIRRSLRCDFERKIIRFLNNY